MYGKFNSEHFGESLIILCQVLMKLARFFPTESEPHARSESKSEPHASSGSKLDPCQWNLSSRLYKEADFGSHGQFTVRPRRVKTCSRLAVKSNSVSSEGDRVKVVPLWGELFSIYLKFLSVFEASTGLSRQKYHTM